MGENLNFRDKKLTELKDICRGDPQKYYGFSKLKKQELINFMYQRNSTNQRSRNPISRPLYYLADCSHIFETPDEREERISELEEIISDLSNERPEDSIIQDLVSSLRREYPSCTITFDENNDKYNDMIYKGNKGKYIQKYGDLGKYGEQILYHGTDKKNLISILNDDFRLTNNPVHGHMYGKGIYFTNDINKAIYYSESGRSTKYILVCMVHIGDICLGNSRMDIHPKMPAYLKDKQYDTSVDNIQVPKQFIKKKNGTYNILGILKIENYNIKQNNQFTGSFQVVNTLSNDISIYWVPDKIVNTLPNVDLRKCKRLSVIPSTFLSSQRSNPGVTRQLCQVGHTFICLAHFPSDLNEPSSNAIIRIFKSKKKGEEIVI